MIWNDDKINRLMSMGVIHGIEAGAGEAAGGGGFGGDVGGPDTGGVGGVGGPGGGRDGGEGGEGGGLSGRGELSVDLGGGVTVGLDPDTGDVTGFSGPGVEGGFAGTQEREAALSAAAPSEFAQFLNALTPTQIGAGLGAIAGVLSGIGPLSGAVAGARIGGKFGPGETDPTQAPPGGFAPTQTAPTATTQAPGLAGVSLGGQGLQGGPGGAQLGGEGQSLQVAAAGRQSGLAPAQQAPQLPQLGALQQRQFLNRQRPLPTVNLQAFPGAIGRIG